MAVRQRSLRCGPTCLDRLSRFGTALFGGHFGEPARARRTESFRSGKPPKDATDFRFSERVLAVRARNGFLSSISHTLVHSSARLTTSILICFSIHSRAASMRSSIPRHRHRVLVCQRLYRRTPLKIRIQAKGGIFLVYQFVSGGLSHIRQGGGMRLYFSMPDSKICYRGRKGSFLTPVQKRASLAGESRSQ